MGDRVAVMKDGVLQQCDTPQAPVDRPANAFVAGFIGSPAMNLLRGALTVDGVRLGTFDVPLSPEQRAALSGPEVLVGLRPEALVPVPGDRPGMPVVVDVVEELGSDTYLYCSTPETEGDLGASRAITVRHDASSDHVGGEQLNLQPQLHAVHLFDAATGRRLPTPSCLHSRDREPDSSRSHCRAGRRRRSPGSAASRWRRRSTRSTTSPRRSPARRHRGCGRSTGAWEFRLVDDPDQVTLADVGTDRTTGGWGELDVPGAWALQGHGAPAYLNVRMPFEGQAPSVPAANPTGIHRRTFTVPARWRGRRLLLRVGAANSMGFVWVNGRFVGVGTDSHLASTYDISGAVRSGRNTVCIVVPQWSASTWVEDQDQWWVAGLHRGVTLVSVPWVSLADTATVPGLATAPRAPSTSTSRSTTPDAARSTTPGGRPHRRGERARPVVATRTPVATTGALAVPVWPQRDPADPDGIAALEHGVTYTWPGHRVLGQLRCRASCPGRTRRRGASRAWSRCRDATGEVIDVRTRGPAFAGSRSPAVGCSQRRRRADQRGEPPRRPPRPGRRPRPPTRVATSN